MKLLRAIILLPMWPLIWKAERDERLGNLCGPCGGSGDGCIRRARAMRKWYEGPK